MIEWSPPSLAYDPWLSRTNDVEEAGPMWNPEHINNALLDERSGKLESDEFKQVCNHDSQAHHMLLISIMSLIAFAECTKII